MNIRELLQSKRTDILQLADKYGASNVRIFGSVARDEMRPDSDIDFLIDLAPDRSLLDHIALMQDLEDLLGHKVDVATVRGLREHVKQRILKEAVPL